MIAITGSTGFVGSYLTKLFPEAVGYNLRDGNDLRDFENLRNFLDIHRPDKIFHLAAQAFVSESFDNPRRTIEVNTIGSLNLLEAVRQLGLKSKILLCGTSEEYGAGKTKETSLPIPESPYAISKLAMDHFGQLYARAYGMNVVVTRTFNHTGPGRGEMYAESSFAKQIAEIEKGTRKVLKHGDLGRMRNYTDVRDVVAAYKLAIDLPPGVYNVCSENTVTINSVLLTLISRAKKNIHRDADPALFRPTDFSFDPPSCTKFKKLTGWEPQYTLDETLTDLLNYWRVKV